MLGVNRFDNQEKSANHDQSLAQGIHQSQKVRSGPHSMSYILATVGKTIRTVISLDDQVFPMTVALYTGLEFSSFPQDDRQTCKKKLILNHQGIKFSQVAPKILKILFQQEPEA
jgi:hypothetical protein